MTQKYLDIQAVSALERRLTEARKKHPVFAEDTYEAFCVIEDEFREFHDAVATESRERQIDEALDVATTCLRFIIGEHLEGGAGHPAAIEEPEE